MIKTYLTLFAYTPEGASGLAEHEWQAAVECSDAEEIVRAFYVGMIDDVWDKLPGDARAFLTDCGVVKGGENACGRTGIATKDLERYAPDLLAPIEA